MLSRPFAAALILITGTAAAGGSYLAVRHNVAEAVQAAPAPAATPGDQAEPVAAPAPPVEPVEATRPTPAIEAPAAPRAVIPRRPKPAPTRAQPAERTLRVAAEPVPIAPPAADAGPDLTPASLDSVAERTLVESDPNPGSIPTDPTFYEIVVPASAVIGLEIETTVTSEGARVEDRVDARVTRDVYADERLAIPAGSRVIGAVTEVERGGKLKDRARLGVRFHTLVLPGGRQVPLRTEAIYREGDSPGAESTRKIGGAAIGGAVLGAILGGGKGAMTGASVGAAGGTAAVMAGGRNAATLAGGSVVTVRLAAPITLEVER